MVIERQVANPELFSVPAAERYFEDYVPGSVYEYGTIRLEEADVIDFGKRYDPQDIHINPDTRGPYGGVIASRWLTVGAMMRLYVENCLSKVANMGSPAVEKLRWVHPVHPGDSLSIRITVLSAKRSRSKPDRGVLRHLVQLRNQHGQVVMSVIPVTIARCKPRE